MVSAANSDCLVFPPFCLDPVRRVLTRDGELVPLTPTLLATLLVLARNAGRVVSKDEMIEAVWGGRLVGESTISQTVFTLRKALAAAGAPGPFIITASGKGYRLAAMVRLQPGPAAEETPPPIIVAPVHVAGGARPRARWVWGAACLAVVGVTAGLLTAARPWATKANEPPATIVQADFLNTTGDPLFDTTLAKVVEIDLGQAPRLRVLTDLQVADTLAMMDRPRDLRVGPAVAREICVRNNAEAVVEGAVALVGRRYVVTLTASDCRDGRLLSARKALVDTRDGVVPALDGLIGATRGTLGETSDSVRRFDVPLLHGRTASLEALQAYSTGVRSADHGQTDEAVALLTRATLLDPAFAAAHLELARALFNSGRFPESRSAIERAYRQRATANEELRYSIAILHALIVELDYPKTLDLAKAATDVFPDHLVGWGQQANIDLQFGRYDDAVRAARRELSLNPGREGAYDRLAQALMAAGKGMEAEQVCRAAASHRVAGGMIAVTEADLAIGRADPAGLRRIVEAANGQSWDPDVGVVAALGAYRAGQIRRGDALFDRAATLYRAAGADGYYTGFRAMALMLAGERRAAARSVDLSPSDIKVMSLSLINIIYALSEGGDGRRAELLLSQAARRGSTDTMLNAVFTPTAHATLDLAQGRATAALAALEPAIIYEARDNAVPYLRGRIALALGDGAGAAQAFRQVIGHPGIDPWDIRHPLAWLGLARAEALRGRRGDSRGDYQRFFALWRDADPDVPVLRQAREEYARL